jgi:histidyl-tRNA synthetase
VATVLRRAGASVEYALREQSLSKQRKASHSAGATYFVTLAPDFVNTRQIAVESFGETADPPLMSLTGAEPLTIDRLVETIRNNPELLSSRL